MNSFIICGDGKQFPIVLNENKNKREISANIAKFADYDGDFVNKRGNRGLEFPIEFLFTGVNYYENTQNFLNSLKDTRPCTFYLPFAENGIKAQVISLEWAESYVRNVECVRFSLVLHETLSKSDFEVEFDEFLEENELTFTLNNLDKQIKNCIQKIEKRQFKISFAQISGFIDSQVSSYSNLAMKFLGVSTDILQEAEAVRLSLVNMSRALQGNFATVMLLFNSFQRLPLKLISANPFEAGRIANFYASSVSDKRVIPQENIQEVYDFTNFENSFYCLNTAIAANAMKDYIATIDYETQLTRRELLEIQIKIYQMYSDFTRINETPNTPENRLTAAYLLSAMLHIDNIFSYGKIEKVFVCEHPFDVYKLVGQLYPCVNPEEYETVLNKFQRDNNLRADELFVLPKGKKVIYYD